MYFVQHFSCYFAVYVLAFMLLLSSWCCFSREKLRIDRSGNTVTWSMSQYRRLFNECKTPGENIDTLNHYFKTGAKLLLYFLLFLYQSLFVSRGCCILDRYVFIYWHIFQVLCWQKQCNVKCSKADVAVCGNYLTATGNCMPYRITQCYLLPAFTPVEAGTRFISPGGMQGWVVLGRSLYMCKYI